jgi:hypothetical protein
MKRRSLFLYFSFFRNNKKTNLKTKEQERGRRSCFFSFAMAMLSSIART